MKIQDFLKHHGIARNPFAEEDAQTDVVFKNHCIQNTFHVGWDKVYGDPADPATSIVFGEKGAGKTAMRLQIQEHVAEHNQANAERRQFMIRYDDFNPFFDRFRDHFGSRFRRADRLLGAWRLWDHMDAILTLGVTKLISELLDQEPAASRQQLRAMPRHLRRDLLLLAACYDQSPADAMPTRWQELRKRMGFPAWKARAPFQLGVLIGVLTLVLFGLVRWNAGTETTTALTSLLNLLPTGPAWGYLLVAGLGFLPWFLKLVRRQYLANTIARRYRVGKRFTNELRGVLMDLTVKDLASQPFPNKDRTDDRYELLGKFQNVLEHCKYSGVLVLMDRLDEPHLINGQAELMRAFLWPLLDNKFLKHPGLGIKMMLPIELRRFVDREDRDFYQRARLDKQNMIPSLQWTGQALWDLATARLSAVASPERTPSLRDLFDDSISDQRLIEGFQSLRVPRHLFKFLYRLLVSHCNAHTDDNPSHQINSHLFESTLAVYGKEIEAADAGVGV